MEKIRTEIRIDKTLWRVIKIMVIDGKIKSLNQAVIEGLKLFVDKFNK